jgi:CheY-like chemotaxis protein
MRLAEHAGKESAKGGAVEAPKRILIVDDEKDFLFSASLALRLAGYDVHAMWSPAKALDTALEAFERRKPFDLMVTDLRMPVMSGVELVEVLRKRGIPLHVLTISSACRNGVLCTMDCACGTNHLDKPFEPWELVERVGKILEKDRTGRNPMRHRRKNDTGIVDLI